LSDFANSVIDVVTDSTFRFDQTRRLPDIRSQQGRLVNAGAFFQNVYCYNKNDFG
jgi:hypothetical protein